MKHLLKVTAAFTLLAAIAAFPQTISHAAVQLPETVRIGLYFNNTSTRMSTALSAFTVSADKGLQIGVYKDGKFSCAYEESSKKSVTVRKDSYFTVSGGRLTEYNPGGSQLPQGDKLGPYHLKLGGSFSNYDRAAAQAEEYAGEGIQAYTVFDLTWQVWTGFYTDFSTAEREADKLRKELGGKAPEIVEPSDDRIVVTDASGDAVFVFGGGSGVLRIRPARGNDPFILNINDKPYRGELEIRRFKTSDMTVINVLPFEEYLYGVVPAELEASADIEALKAQAVVARTYAFNNLKSYESLDFDLCYTTYTQVYKGFSIEADSTTKAVDATAGKLVLYEGKPAEVFYFSSSGGWTEDSNNVWSADLPYLKSVEDKYESGKSWNYTWETVYTADEIKSAMLGRNYDLGDITSVRITKTSTAGRVTELVIEGTKDSVKFEKSGCRSVLGNLYSQWYTVSTDAGVIAVSSGGTKTNAQIVNSKAATADGVKTVKAAKASVTVMGSGGAKKTYSTAPSTYKFSGRGNGHAVGMSQEGAKGMARAGYSSEQIIAHYFNGAKME